MLFASYFILFVRYVIATFLSTFFPKYATDKGINSTVNGLIFASYPAGIAIASPFAAGLIGKLGTRTAIVAGLVSTSVMTFAFGLVPMISSQLGAQQAGFIITYFLSGLLGSLAETGCIIILSNRFADRLGTVMAAVGTVCGVGCMVGPLLGGVVYAWGSQTPFNIFFFPFFVFGILSGLLSVFLACVFPNANIANDEEAAPISSVMSTSMILNIGAVALSGTIVATLDPTLSFRLGQGSSFNLSDTMVGVWFMVSSIVYVVASIPVGWVVDKYKGESKVFKTLIAVGFFSLFLTFCFLGPLKLPGTGTLSVFDNIYWVGCGMCLKGIGSAVSVNPVYPDLVDGIPESDEMLIATILGLWNSAYAVGWAFGPLVGGALYDGLGFDGFATVAALICLVYSFIMFAAAYSGIKGSHTSYEVPSSGTKDSYENYEALSHTSQNAVVEGRGQAASPREPGTRGTNAPIQFTQSMERQLL